MAHLHLPMWYNTGGGFAAQQEEVTASLTSAENLPELPFWEALKRNM